MRKQFVILCIKCCVTEDDTMIYPSIHKFPVYQCHNKTFTAFANHIVNMAILIRFVRHGQWITNAYNKPHFFAQRTIRESLLSSVYQHCFHSGSELPSLMLNSTLCMCVGSVCGPLYLCVACLYFGPSRAILWLRRKRTPSSNIARLAVNKATPWSVDQWRQGPWKSCTLAQLHFKRSELYYKTMTKGNLQQFSVCFASGIEWVSAVNSRARKPLVYSTSGPTDQGSTWRETEQKECSKSEH